MFVGVLEGFRTCSDAFGCVRMHSDAFGCVWTHSDAFGHVRTRSDMFGCVQKCLDTFALFGWVRSCSDAFGHILIENFSIQVRANIDLAETAVGRNYGKSPNLRNRNVGESFGFLIIVANFQKFSVQAILPREC